MLQNSCLETSRYVGNYGRLKVTCFPFGLDYTRAQQRFWEILVDDLSSSDIPYDSGFLPVDFTVPLVEGKVVFTFMLGLKICLRTMQQKARDKSKNRLSSW